MMKRAVQSLLALSILITTAVFAPMVGHAQPTLRIALLPIPDALPAYVAIEKGYFKELGIGVKPISVGSALERDQLMQAGRIDAMVNEIAGTASFNRNKILMKTVAIARAPMGEAPLFRLLTAPKSGISTIDELSGVPIAVSMNTVIEYLTDRMLQDQGLAPKNIAKQSVPVLPERMQLLLSGQIKAATLPDPLAFAAMKAGARMVMDDTRAPLYSASVLSFSAKTLEKAPRAVEAFVKGWMKAAADLNAQPEAFRPLMLKKIRVPKNVQNSFPIPPFPVHAIPSKAQWDDTMDWMIQKGLLKKPVSYELSVQPYGFTPQKKVAP